MVSAVRIARSAPETQVIVRRENGSETLIWNRQSGCLHLQPALLIEESPSILHDKADSVIDGCKVAPSVPECGFIWRGILPIHVRRPIEVEIGKVRCHFPSLSYESVTSLAGGDVTAFFFHAEAFEKM